MIPSLKPEDDIDKALGWMEENKVLHLPLINKGKYMGLLEEEQLLSSVDHAGTVEDIEPHFHEVYAKEQDHIFEVFNDICKHNLSVFPVLDQKGERYVGAIGASDLIKVFGEISAIKSPGAIIVLYLHEKDYSLSEISRIIESNGSKILGSFVMSNADDPTSFELTLKLNRSDITRVIAALERYDYTVLSKFTEEEIVDESKENLDQFFKYLDI
jgi:predicted transcriptional regulator